MKKFRCVYKNDTNKKRCKSHTTNLSRICDKHDKMYIPRFPEKVDSVKGNFNNVGQAVSESILQAASMVNEPEKFINPAYITIISHRDTKTISEIEIR